MGAAVVAERWTRENNEVFWSTPEEKTDSPSCFFGMINGLYAMRVGGVSLTGLTARQSTSAPCARNVDICVHVMESQNVTSPIESPETIVP